MNWKSFVVGFVLCFALILGSTHNAAASKQPPPIEPTVTLLASGLEGAMGSTIGPDDALYVTESAAGRIARIDPHTGEVTTFASGLPPSLIGLGGVMDVAFMGGTAYALVTLVGEDVGGDDVVGIYRVDGPDSFTVIADIGQFAMDNPPDTEFEVPTGVQYAMENYGGAFLVTDGHHNRVLRATLNGEISVVMAFDDIVPTGLEVLKKTIYMAEAGPNPHPPEVGKVVSFRPKWPMAREIASGAPLLVDVEFGLGHRLYALSQGDFEEGLPDGAPAMPNTGALVMVSKGSTFTTIVDELDRPTSMEFMGNTAYVVSMAGEVLKIENVFCPPLGVSE